MTIKELKKLKKQGLINFPKLAELSGMKYQTLAAKLRRNSELKVNESLAIEKALEQLK